MRPRHWLFAAASLLLPIVAGCSSAPSDDAQGSEDAITDIPQTGVRNQKDTGNCWLFATAAWAEGLEYQALIEQGHASASDPSTRPAHFSIAYLDYWDWYTKITTKGIKGTRAQPISDALDSGGSWGAAVEVVENYGMMRQRDFVGASPNADANTATSALKAMTTSLSSGALKSAAARANPKLVRQELDKAFGLGSDVAGQLTRIFGAEGSKTFEGGARSTSTVLGPADLQIFHPRPDAAPELVTLSDAIGKRAGGDDPDKRSGPHAWNVTPFENKSAAETRAYFKRIQRALHAGVALPISWYVASNGDPSDTGVYKATPSSPADPDQSGGHETLITDYEIDNVPGWGRLKAGEKATPDQLKAALDDRATVVFLRIKNSWGAHVKKNASVGYNDLYFDYLTNKVRVCPTGEPATSAKCTDEMPLEDVTLPPGF